MKVIIGLGNPGIEYKNTRHNIGFIFLDFLVEKLNLDSDWTLKHQSLIIKFNKNGEDILLCKPQTYMNSSGDAIRSIKNFYKLEDKDFLIIHDELHINTGSFKFAIFKSDGGHNGVKSIISSLNNNSFLRLRIGIGNNEIKNIKKFVLEEFKEEELISIKNLFNTFLNSINDFLSGISPEQLMNSYH